MQSLHYASLAASLAADAFAVSISMGLTDSKASIGGAVRVGLFFGGFQALMPLLGYLLGSTFSDFIKQFDHWIAFAMLTFIGIKMIKDGLHGEEGTRSISPAASLQHLTLLSIATSMDALAVGISIAVLHEKIWISAVWIGTITFALSTIGVLTGKHLGCRIGKYATVSGGAALLIIGVKILLEHMR